MIIRGILILVLAILGAGLLNMGLSPSAKQETEYKEMTVDAIADGASAEDVVTHHIEAFIARDLDAIMSDYAPGAILIGPDGTAIGKEQIRDLINTVVELGDQSEAPFNVTMIHSVDSLAYLLWTWTMKDGSEVQGTDTFVIKNGKIVQQTVAYLGMPAPDTEATYSDEADSDEPDSDKPDSGSAG